jgi:hypothetical protein
MQMDAALLAKLKLASLAHRNTSIPHTPTQIAITQGQSPSASSGSGKWKDLIRSNLTSKLGKTSSSGAL